MAAKKGSLSISSENIFPIIKKWVYSDHDIFVREMVSNGCDAITKLKKLDVMGEYQIPDDYKASIQVEVNPEEKTLKFTDNGLGMTAEEVEEYITQIAFSGATEFLEKYKDKTTEDDMIGHFGLGFYSAFMVADEVHIDTLSYKEGAAPVHWVSAGGTEYEMEDGSKDTVGTEITLCLNEDSLEFANEYRVREVIEKYCSFMPVPIFLSKANAETEYETIDEEDLKEDDVVVEHIHEDAKTEEKENENGEKEIVEVEPAKEKVKIEKRPVSLSDTSPLWAKHPNDCSDEDYQEFYRKVFLDYKEPLFWIHLNMDYPFNLKGILYFPRINTEYDSIEGTIKLYNNQVFIADNIKEVIPEFLMVLKGVIDCPDLPLNVSRSALQNDGFVNKIADYISKKVADKLSGMCKTKREDYEKYWDNISPFIKFGCLKDEKFCDKMKDAVLFKNIDGKYLTLKDCIEENGGEVVETNEKKEENENEDENKVEEIKTTIYYVTDEIQQSQYINMFRSQGQDAVILNHNIDSPFITQLEQRNPTIRFQRIDADVTETVKEEVAEEDQEAFKEVSDSLIEIFRKELGNDKLDVKIEKLKDEKVASMITLSEQNRRMQEMMKMYGMNDMDMGGESTLVLNANHPLVKFVVDNKDHENVSLICKQLYDLAMLAHRPLKPEDMTAFVQRSNEIMMMLTK
ncbi:molecular chaperone HtpG [Lachnospiraceae bacterium 48-42]|nr:molecular chaperone HtpG [Dorea sp.]